MVGPKLSGRPQQFTQFTKICFRCKEEKPLKDFRTTMRSRSGFDSYCWPCARIVNKEEWDRRSPDKVAKDAVWSRRYALAKYGLTLEGYDRLLQEQGGACLCGAKTGNDAGYALFVDHSRATGSVRGLLCGRCNLAIGYALDDPARLRALADYLERHAAATP